MYSDEQRKRAKEEAQEQAKNMQLNVVRLKFQAYITDPPAGPQQLPPVYSHTIFDSSQYPAQFWLIVWSTHHLNIN